MKLNRLLQFIPFCTYTVMEVHDKALLEEEDFLILYAFKIQNRIFSEKRILRMQIYSDIDIDPQIKDEVLQESRVYRYVAKNWLNGGSLEHLMLQEIDRIKKECQAHATLQT
jgi:hypothetical protein